MKKSPSLVLRKGKSLTDVALWICFLFGLTWSGSTYVSYHSQTSLRSILIHTPTVDAHILHFQRSPGIQGHKSTQKDQKEVFVPQNQQHLRQQDRAQKAFYQHHVKFMMSSINDTTALYWDTWNPVSNFGPFKEALDNLYTVPLFPQNNSLIGRPKVNTSHFVLWKNTCAAAKAFQEYHTENDGENPAHPHVLLVRMNENWGEFSKEIPGKTASWEDGTDWKKQGCSEEEVFDYFNHKDTRAVVTTQFHAFDHPKVHSIPLGIQSIETLNKMLREMQNPTNRTQLLMVNHQPRKVRIKSVQTVMDNFKKHGISLQNTYPMNYGDYLAELHASKFILSPGGMGLDCYRHWEALYLGTIPVVEHLNRTDGWLRTLEGLPVAWIDSYDNLTPQFLENEFQRIIDQSQSFQYEKLTKHWWIRMIKATLNE